MALTEQQAYDLIHDTAYRLKSNYAYFKDIDIELVTQLGIIIAKTETGGKLNPTAKNTSSTAKGLMQVVDGTKKSMEKNYLKIPVASDKRMFEPGYNALIGLAYLAYQLKRYGGDPYKAVIAYNQGHYDSNSPTAYYDAFSKWDGRTDFAALSNNYEGSGFTYSKYFNIKLYPEFT